MGQLYETRLAQILGSEGRTQAWLARVAEIDGGRQRVNLIVHGLIPTEDEAARIAGALGRELDEVFGPMEQAA